MESPKGVEVISSEVLLCISRIFSALNIIPKSLLGTFFNIFEDALKRWKSPEGENPGSDHSTEEFMSVFLSSSIVLETLNIYSHFFSKVFTSSSDGIP